MSDTAVASQPRDMTAADLDRVVELHKACFDGYFLTALGDGVLRQFYRQAVDDPRSCATVLEETESGRLIGLAVGSLDPAFHTKLMRRQFPRFAWAIASGAVVNPAVRRGLWERLGFAKRLFVSRGDTGLADAGIPPADGPEARCLDVALHPERRGGGYAEKLLAYLTQRIFETGAARFGGSLRPQNLPSMILHKRLGWNVKRTGPNRVDVWIDRSTIEAQRGAQL